MDRKEQHEDLIDLGSVTVETKGLSVGQVPDIGAPKYDGTMGLSND